MKKTLIATGILALAAVSLGAYLYLFDREDKGSGDPPKWEPAPVFSGHGEQLDRVTIKTHEKHIVMEYEESVGAWMLREPVNAFVDPISARILTGDLLRLEKERLIELDPEELSKYRLDDPLAEITCHFADTEDEVTLLVGKLNYTQDNYFAMLQSEPLVFLVPTSVKTALNVTADSMRSKRLLYHEPKEIVKVDIKVHDPELKKLMPQILEPVIVLQKSESGRPEWVIVRPVKEKAHFKYVDEFFRALRFSSNLGVIDVEKEQLPEFGLDRPRASIKLAVTRGPDEEIIFGRTDQEKGITYAMNTLRGEAVLMKTDLFYSIIASHFRQKTLMESRGMGFHPDRVEMIFPSRPEDSFTILYEKDRIYRFEKEPDKKVFNRRFRFLILPFMKQELTYLDHLAPFNRQELGLDEPVLRIRMVESGQLIMDVSVGDTLGDYRGLTSTAIEDHIRGYIASLPLDVLDEIPYKKQHFVATKEELSKMGEARRRGREK